MRFFYFNVFQFRRFLFSRFHFDVFPGFFTNFLKFKNFHEIPGEQNNQKAEFAKKNFNQPPKSMLWFFGLCKLAANKLATCKQNFHVILKVCFEFNYNAKNIA